LEAFLDFDVFGMFDVFDVFDVVEVVEVVDRLLDGVLDFAAVFFKVAL
jgi:hypothetical protein